MEVSTRCDLSHAPSLFCTIIKIQKNNKTPRGPASYGDLLLNSPAYWMLKVLVHPPLEGPEMTWNLSCGLKLLWKHDNSLLLVPVWWVWPATPLSYRGKTGKWILLLSGSNVSILYINKIEFFTEKLLTPVFLARSTLYLGDNCENLWCLFQYFQVVYI